MLCHSGLGWGLFGVFVMRLRGSGWGLVVVSAAALLLLAALGLALALILTRESLLHHNKRETILRLSPIFSFNH